MWTYCTPETCEKVRLLLAIAHSSERLRSQESLRFKEPADSWDPHSPQLSVAKLPVRLIWKFTAPNKTTISSKTCPIISPDWVHFVFTYFNLNPGFRLFHQIQMTILYHIKCPQKMVSLKQPLVSSCRSDYSRLFEDKYCLQFIWQ